MLANYLNNGYRDELITAAGIAGLCALASFVVLAQVAPNPKTNDLEAEAVLGIQSDEEMVVPQSQVAQSENNSIAVISAPSPTPSSSPTPSPEASTAATPTPTPTPNTVEIPYGSSQDFENNDYVISFSDPILTVGASRIFRVKVVIGNKKVEEFIDNTLLGEIRRDGQVVSARAPLTLSEIKSIKPGEQLTFTASLSLPESTQLTRITFDPPGDPLQVIYNLDPTL
jgi:hypothetical protein